MDRYLALSALEDLTRNHEPAHDLHQAASLGIQVLVDGNGSGVEPGLIRRLGEAESMLAQLLQEARGRGAIDDYRRFRAITHTEPSAATWAPRLFISHQEVSAPQIDFTEGTNAVVDFLEDLKRLPTIEGGWPMINFFNDSQPLILADTETGLLRARNYLAAMTLEFFGKAIALEDLLAGFVVDLPGYRLARLDMEFISHGHLDVRGVIRTTAGGRDVAGFRRSIPVRPPDGQHWIARSYGIGVADDGLQRQGIGRQLTQRFLAFVERIGVDAVDFPVSNAGALVFPKLGFDFARPEVRNRVKIQFREFLKRRFPQRDRSVDENWARIEHSWEIAGFRLTDQYPAGRDFLIELGRNGDQSSYGVRFWTRRDYEGWGLLFSERTPPEWRALAPETRRFLQDYHRTQDQMPALLNSFRGHVGNLHETLGNWLLPVDFYLRNREGHNHLHLLAPGEVQELHDQFVHTAGLIAWMSDANMRDTPLGRAFWATMRTETWTMLPRLAQAAHDLLGLDIAFPTP